MMRIVSPDCRDQNHQKCPGDAWDEPHDHVTECQCVCHGQDSTDTRLIAAGLALAERYKLTGRLVMDDARAALAAADSVDPLRQPGHRVEIQGFSWTLQHPAECRPNMLSCPLTRAIAQHGVSSIKDGIWTVYLDEDKEPCFTPEVES